MLRKLPAVTCLAVTLLTACVPPAPLDTSTAQAPAANDVQFNSISTGYYQGTAQKQLVVIQSSSELSAALADITLLGPTPTADFSSQTLIGVYISGISAGCENAAITAITDDGDHLTVNVRKASISTLPNATEPPACLPLNIDGGYAFVTITKNSKPVTLVTSGEVQFKVVAKGTFNGAAQNRFFVIQSDAELTAALAEVSIRNYPPITADFATQTLIGVFVAHSSPCDTTVVTSIKEDAAGLTVNANHVSRPNAICITSIVAGSYAFVTIPKTSKPASFVITKVEPVAGGDIQFNKVSAGYYQGTAKEQLSVIQSSSELDTALAGITLLGTTPAADFTTQTLIGGFVTYTSGCDGGTVITKITDDGTTLTVNANHITLANTLCAAVYFNGTYAFVTLPKTTKPATFIVTEVLSTL